MNKQLGALESFDAHAVNFQPEGKNYQILVVGPAHYVKGDARLTLVVSNATGGWKLRNFHADLARR